MDDVMVVNEIVDFAKQTKCQVLILKVGFQKAYYLVDWNFLEYMMGRVGLCQKWVTWMKACVCLFLLIEHQWKRSISKESLIKEIT